MVVDKWLRTIQLQHPPVYLSLNALVIVHRSPNEIAFLNYCFVYRCVIGLVMMALKAAALLLCDYGPIAPGSQPTCLAFELLFNQLFIVQDLPATSLVQSSHHQLRRVPIVSEAREYAFVPVASSLTLKDIILISRVVPARVNHIFYRNHSLRL